MRARTWLLALATATGLATTAAAEPPIKPLGRYVAAPEITAPSAWATMSDMVWEALLDHMTFPLGTATSPRERLGA